MRYLARRVLHGAVLLLVLSVLSFLFASLAPGDFYSDAPVENISSQSVNDLRAQGGLDRPLPVRYFAWASSMLRGDFGYSVAYSSPVGPLLRPRIGATLLLNATATLLAWLTAVPLGVWLATQRRTWRETVANFLIALLLAVPELLLAIALLLLAVETNAFPIGGMTSGDGGWRDLLWHLALPAVVLAAGTLPILLRHVRSALIEVMDAPFALAARAHGIPPRRILFRHLIPAAMNPLISLFGISIGTLLSASLLVEVVMGWPGIGPLFLDAIMARDFSIVLAVVMLSATFLIAGNLLADLLLYRFDPRIRR